MNLPLIRLEGNDRPFTANPAESYTLPARFYHDQTVFEQERPAIFYKNWWYVCHASQVSEPGCFAAANVHDQGVFAVRTRDGKIRSFYNVCKHRGHELVQGTGRTNLITCPYHAWAYDLDGRLKRARNSERVACFDKSEFSLSEVRTEVFLGMVFVNLDPDAAPLAVQAEGLETEIRKYCPQLDELQFVQRDRYAVKSNWKVLIDNFLECYHCHTAHKDFVTLCDMESYRSRVHGIYSSHCSAKARSTSNSAYSFETGVVDFGYAGWFLWPNLTIWIYPGEPNLSVLQMLPDTSETTVEFQDWFLTTPEPSSQVRDAMVYQKDVLQPEDIRLCESVQKGLRSKGYNQGRFIVDDDQTELSEHAVHHFQRLYAEAVAGSQQAKPHLRPLQNGRRSRIA